MPTSRFEAYTTLMVFVSFSFVSNVNILSCYLLPMDGCSPLSLSWTGHYVTTFDAPIESSRHLFDGFVE